MKLTEFGVPSPLKVDFDFSLGFGKRSRSILDGPLNSAASEL
jgi:hypothetical protein